MKQRKNPLVKKKNNKHLVLAFALPFSIVLVALFIGEHWPFGDKQILAHDMWHQYYPFFVSFRNKLLSGGSLQFTWDVGMGTGYYSLFTYYLASPLNLLSVLIPEAFLREYFSLMVALKIGFAGFSFAYYLGRIYHREDRTADAFFGLLYALCAYVAGYYWNIMWLDTFALLPLLVAGTVVLLREGKYRLYLGALVLSLWCNYYLSVFCCIFVALCFFAYCICRPNGILGFLRRLARISLCTLIGIGLAAVILLPTLIALQNTYTAGSEMPNLLALNIAKDAKGNIPEGSSIWHLLLTETIPGVLKAMKDVLSGLLTATSPTKMEGLPNIFCGFSTVVLAVFYFCCSKISLREKLVHMALLLFLSLSFIFRILDYVWHGFHFPNMLPYRFSFLFSFVLLSMAYRAYCHLGSFKSWHLPIIISVCGGILLCGLGQERSATRIILSASIVLVCLLIFYLFRADRTSKAVASWLLALLFFAEASVSFACGVAKVDLTTRSTYPEDHEGVQSLLDASEAREDELFWRSEMTATQTFNDGALNGYHGLSIFTSSANVRFNHMSRSFGFASWPASNRYIYYQSAPFTNTMCGVKYLIARDGKHLDTDNTTLVASSEGVLLLENDSYISLGFVADASLGEFVAESNVYNPIREQEDMFRMATGIEDPLYTHLTHNELTAPEGCELYASGTSGTQYSYSTEDAEGTVDLSISFVVPRDGLVCATTKSNGNYKLNVSHNGTQVLSRDIKVRSLIALGTFCAGDVVTMTYPIEAGKSGTVSVDLVQQNDAVFQAGIEKLSRSPWKLTKFSDTHLCGTVTAEEAGLFYTAIPYEPGWRAYVDGKEVPLAQTYDPEDGDLRLTDAMIAFPISEGSHEVELRYRTPMLTEGIIISLVSLLGLILLVILTRKTFILFPEKPSNGTENTQQSDCRKESANDGI